MADRLGRLRLAAVSLLAPLLLAACGAAKPPDPLGLIQGALAQEYFDSHHAIPSTQEETLLGREAQGMLSRIEAMPAPAAAAAAPAVDVATVRATHGAAAVDEALLAAYILHFHAAPDANAQSQLAVLAGSGEGPLPVVKA